MRTQLKTRNIAELLDKAIHLYRENFQTLAGITFIALAPITILQLTFFRYKAFIHLFSWLFVEILTEVTLTAAVAQTYLWEPISISEAYKRGWKRFGATWAASFLIGIVTIPIVWLLCSGIITLWEPFLKGDLGATIISISIIIIMLSAGLFFRTRFSMITPATTLELKNGSQAISRSWQLTDGYFWHCLGVTIVAGLLVDVISALPGHFMMLIPGGQYSLVIEIIAIVIDQAALLVTLPLKVCVITLLYYDLRVRKERYDLELRAEQALQTMDKGSENQKEPAILPTQ